MKVNFLSFFLLPIWSITAIAAETTPADNTRQTLAEWVQTQRILSDEKTAWRQEQDFLEHSIALLERERALLSARLRELEQEGDTTARERLSLTEKNEAFRAASGEAGELLALLEEELQLLRPWFPPPLQSRVAPLFSRLERAPDNADQTAQRLQSVLGILNEVNRFQRNVTLSRETHQFDDGTHREVRTIYLGLAHAFFVDDQGRIAGSGRPDENSWNWSRNDGIAAAVSRAVAILENQRSPEFVNLPVEMKP